MYAAMKGHSDAVAQLIEAGVDLESQSNQRCTALMYAARGGHLEVVKALLRAKADPDVHRSYDMADTPLIIAARGGYFEIVRELVAAGADVSIYGGIAGITAECAARHAHQHAISEFLCYNEKRMER
jgi:ankyrin repeat protein